MLHIFITVIQKYYWRHTRSKFFKRTEACKNISQTHAKCTFRQISKEMHFKAIIHLVAHQFQQVLGVVNSLCNFCNWVSYIPVKTTTFLQLATIYHTLIRQLLQLPAHPATPATRCMVQLLQLQQSQEALWFSQIVTVTHGTAANVLMGHNTSSCRVSGQLDVLPAFEKNSEKVFFEFGKKWACRIVSEQNMQNIYLYMQNIYNLLLTK